MANADTQEVQQGHGVGATPLLRAVGQRAVLGRGAVPQPSRLSLDQVQHYVEKPSTFVSEVINCGIYLFTPAIFQHIGEVFQRNQQELAL